MGGGGTGDGRLMVWRSHAVLTTMKDVITLVYGILQCDQYQLYCRSSKIINCNSPTLNNLHGSKYEYTPSNGKQGSVLRHTV